MSNITRTNFPRQFEHVAVVAHGAHPEYRLEFDAKVKNEAASLKIKQGSIVSLDANGEFVVGCGEGTGVNYPVPMISLKNVVDPDVTAGVQGADYRTSTYSAIGGKITAIPCTAGYEIETTEFVAQGGSTKFAPGDALIPATSTDIGKVKIATKQPYLQGTTADTVFTAGSEVIVGFVSKAEYVASNYNHTRLSFFTNFIPVSHSSSN